MVTDISQLKFKKDEKFLNNNIYISKSGTMYMTANFASYLYGSNLTNKIKNWYHLKHYITYSDIFRCQLCVRKFSGLQEKGFEKFNFYLCGSSGSHGFGGLQDTKRETLGIRTVRRANKYIIGQYLISHLSRLDKIKKIVNKIKDQKYYEEY
jgi:hypothetical protein